MNFTPLLQYITYTNNNVHYIQGINAYFIIFIAISLHNSGYKNSNQLESNGKCNKNRWEWKMKELMP